MIRLAIPLFAAFTLSACGEDQQSAAEEPAAEETYVGVAILADVPEGTDTVYLATNRNGWSADASPMTPDLEEPDRHRAQLLLEEGYELEYKFTLGDWEREAVDENDVAYPNHTLTAEEGLTAEHEVAGFRRSPKELMDDAAYSGVIGQLDYWPDFESEFLEPTRHVAVFTPPGYHEPRNADKRYPVIYMTDGQNVFDPRLANYGIDWGIDEAMSRGIEGRVYDGAIVVTHTSTEDRGEEYSPWHGAPKLARMVIEEIKPRVDREYRTLPDRENTFAMGSSMGGLHAMYLVLNHGDVFSACGCVSTHLPFSEAVVARYSNRPGAEDADETPYFLRDIEAGRMTPPEGARMFFDWGTATLDAQYPEPHAALREHFVSLGLTEGEDFLFREYPGAKHNEAAWRARVEDQLEWLLAGTVPAPSSPLAGFTWTVEDIAGEPIVDGSSVEIRFDRDGTVSGSTGCNRFTATYRDEDTLSIGPLGMSRMNCPEALNSQQRSFAQLLSDAESYSFDDQGVLIITASDGRTLRATTD